MKAKPRQGMPLHQYIATGGLPSQYIGSKGIENTKGTRKNTKKK